MFASTRQPGWGLVSVLAGIAVLVVLERYWSSEKATAPSPRPFTTTPRARGIFAPMGAGQPRAKASSPGPVEPRQSEPRRETISGRVVAPDGSPIPGAALTLGKELALSDAEGRFQIAASSGRLRVTHPTHFPREVEAEGAKTMSLVLLPGTKISGRVTGPGGQAVAGARVELGTTEEPPTVFAGPTGEFESPLLVRGPVCVVVSHASYQPMSRVLNLREPLERLNVQLAAGDRLVIHAREPDGASLPDVEVWIGATESDAGPTEWRFMGRTDDLGRLETRKEPGIRATLRLSLAGFRDATTPIEPRVTDVQTILPPVPALRGQAIDARTGLPVRISALRLEILAGESYVETPHRGELFQSLETGKLVVGLPPQPGTYRLHVRAASSDDPERSLEGESEPFAFDGTLQPAFFVVRLEERIELRGLVQGAVGLLDGLELELFLDAPPEAILGSLEDGPDRQWIVAGVKVPAPLRKLHQTRTRERGQFEFKDLSHGTYRIRVKPKETGAFAEYLSAPFALPWEGEFPVALRRGAIVGGTLYNAQGLPWPNMPVILIHEQDWARLTSTDSAGRYELRDVGPGGGYRLVVGSAGGATAHAIGIERQLTVEEGRDVIYDLHPSEWSGQDPARAPDAAQAPSTEASPANLARGVAREDDLIIAPQEASAKESAEDFDPGWTASDERADIEDLGPEPDTHPNSIPTPTPAPAPAQREPQRPTPGEPSREAAHAGSIRLRLVDPTTQEKLPSDAEIEVEELEGHKGWRGRARAGEFAIAGLTKGRHRVRVKSRGLVLAEREIDVQGSAEATLALEEPHDVSVRLQQADGKPFRGRATVILKDAGREILRTVEDIQDVLTVPTPGPGEYELTVESEEYLSRMRVKVTREVAGGEAR